MLLAGCLALGCGGGSENGGGSGGAGAKGGGRGKRPSGPRQVQVAHPEPFPYQRVLRVGGTLEPAETVQVPARVDGAVTAVLVDLGDRVARNAVLARITATDFRARAAQLDAEIDQATVDLQRLEGLAAQQLATGQAVEQARTKIAVLRAQRTQAGRQLRDTAVTAPFAGAIAARHVAPGAWVRTGSPLFDLVAVDRMQVALQVPERHAAVVVAGTTLDLKHESSPATVPATVVRVAPTVDPGSRTFRVEATVEAASAGALRAGMFVEASLPLGRVDDSVRVPRAAVYESLGQARVTLVRDGRAQPRDVEHLGDEDGWAVVTGIGPADVVVTRSPATLAPGTAVAAERAAESPVSRR